MIILCFATIDVQIQSVADTYQNCISIAEGKDKQAKGYRGLRGLHIKAKKDYAGNKADLNGVCKLEYGN